MNRIDPISDQRDWHDPKGQAIHNATQAIYDLFELLPRFDAHWYSTVAIINAERAARSKQHG